MGRKSIPYNQRARPISFSLKPHFIEKIESYCEDHHFNRSKFLQEAVNRYMLANDMDYLRTSNKVDDMDIHRRVAVGLAALQEANRDGETIKKPIMDALRNELPVTLKDLNTLETHDLTALMLNIREWSCPHCEKTTTSLQGMRKHMVKMHDYHPNHWDV